METIDQNYQRLAANSNDHTAASGGFGDAPEESCKFRVVKTQTRVPTDSGMRRANLCRSG